MPVGVIGSGMVRVGRTRTDRPRAAGTRLSEEATGGAVTGRLVGMLPPMARTLMARTVLGRPLVVIAG
ncbi:hypothetical protein [Microtetraspora malaysiensis]|uniref:hypothetical protein n=1 Tax=Microtetraspora malaysiensis TaxID=161358 RepID=UPI003D8FB35E